MSHPTQLSRIWIEKLMEISTALGDYTHSVAQCSKIPAYLSRALAVGPITLAIVNIAIDGAPQIALMNSSLPAATTASAGFIPEVLALFQTSYSAPAEHVFTDPAGQDAAVGDGTVPTEAYAGSFAMSTAGYPMAMVLTHEIDDAHQMLLMLHQEDRYLPQEVHETLLLIVGQLSKLLKCMVACTGGSNILGGRFNRLTEREWMVLRVLNSEDGEKQLADRLSLSPHTLHSHIKSIYRKVGVQGRLSLLSRLREAQQELRLATLSSQAEESAIHNVGAMN